MKKLTLFVALLSFSGLACAQVMAARQPGRLDRRVLQPNAERAAVVGTLGAPSATEEAPGGLHITDTHNYTDGGKINSWGAKAGRIVLYTAGDVFTFFLTQILWIPAELALDGTDYSATVQYERRGSDQRWIASRVTETKQEGNRKTTVVNKDSLAPAVSSPLPAQPPIAALDPAFSNGTCFAIDSNGVLLTALHLVSTTDLVRVRLADGRQFQAAIESRSRGADLAVLRIDEPTPDFLALSSVTAPTIGERVFTMGFPTDSTAGPGPTFFEGSVASLTGPNADATLLGVTVPLHAGNAGGPLVNERGEILGIVTFVDPPEGSGSWAINANYALPLVSPPYAVPLADNRDDAIEQTRAALCRVESP